MTTYLLNSDAEYGWLTGITSDGLQVIVADNANIYFSPDGSFISASHPETATSWAERAKSLIAQQQPIKICEFQIQHASIGLTKYPAGYADDPSGRTEWDKSGSYVLYLGDDFWVGPDGKVHSH